MAKKKRKKAKRKPKRRAKAKVRRKPKTRRKTTRKPKKRAKRKAKKRPKARKKRARNKATLKKKAIRTEVTRTAEGYLLEETYKPSARFDPDSFRTKKPRPGVLLVTGCPKGKWDKDAQLCRVGVQLHSKKKAISAAEAKRLRAKGARAKSNRSALARDLLNRARRGKVTTKAQLLPGRKARASKKPNYMLMTVTNPTTTAELRKAKKAFKRWHFKGPSFATKARVPNGYPNALVNLGQMESFEYSANGKTWRWKAPGKKPTIAANPAGNRAYVLGGDFKGLPNGARMTRIDYRIPLPPRSNRIKLGSRRWYHPFDNPPVIHVNKSGGFWVTTPVKPEGFSG